MLQLTTMGVPGDVKPWSIEFGADVGWLPSLNAHRSLLINSGRAFSLTTGVAVRANSKIRVADEISYAPLTVRRSGVQARDGLVNLRVSAFYSWR